MESNTDYFQRNKIIELPPPTSTNIYNKSTHEAAVALQDLALNRQRTYGQACLKTNQPRKRERPLSMDINLQDTVRSLLGDITNVQAGNEDDGIAVSNDTLADSFMVPKGLGVMPPAGVDDRFKPIFARELPRKRTCAASTRAEARKLNLLVAEQATRQGPGMWEGVI